MDIGVSIAESTAAGHGVGEQTRSLFAWLAQEAELRGRLRLVEAEPSPGALGSVPTELLVTLGPGGAGGVLASAVIAWIRHRTSEVSCTFKRPDGTSVKLTGKRIRETDITKLGELIGQVAAVLDGLPDQSKGD